MVPVPGRLVVLLLAIFLSAARPYHDTKDRFSLELAPGWELAPQFGDTLGMVFKKIIGQRPPVMALFMVRVAPPGTAGSRTFADATEEVFAAQPGFHELGESRIAIGGRDGFVRRYEAEVDAKAGLKKRIDAYYLEANGAIYLLHVETTARDRPKIDADVQRMLASFVPGRPTGEEPPPPSSAAPRVAGRWINGDGLILTLEDDATFTLADVGGRYEVTADSLTLIIPNKGRESFSFVLGENTLTLRSPNLGEPMTYRRAEGKTKHHSSTDFVGAWETVGTSRPVSLALHKSGRFEMGEFAGKWRYENGQLHLERSKSEVIVYDAKLTGKRLILAGADLDRPIALERK